MYQGYMTFGGVEIINAARTAAYCMNANVPWFYGCEECPDLVAGLGDEPYSNPGQDDAAWFDPDDASTWRFYGCYPLSITGIEDSTYTAQAVESVQHGGVVTVPRATTRTVVVSAMLLGGDDHAVDSGMNWLRGALRGSPCGPVGVGCTGDTVCFLLGCPEICGDTDEDEQDCLTPFLVHMHQVTTIEGPKVTAKHAMNDGGSVWEIEWTMVAAKPWICDSGWPAIHGGSGHGDPNPFRPIYNVPTVDCSEPPVPTFRDPTCPPLPTPPSYPKPPLNCFTLPTNWDRYSLMIPAAQVPRWSNAVPEITIQAQPGDVPTRNVRVRFYEDPLNWFSPLDLSDCGFCSEFLITYIPAGYSITIDGMTETILMSSGNVEDQTPDKIWNAAQSVTSTDQTGFTWPSLTCGAGYIMTVDVPHGAPPPLNVDVTIFHRSA